MTAVRAYEKCGIKPVLRVVNRINCFEVKVFYLREQIAQRALLMKSGELILSDLVKEFSDYVIISAGGFWRLSFIFHFKDSANTVVDEGFNASQNSFHYFAGGGGRCEVALMQ